MDIENLRVGVVGCGGLGNSHASNAVEHGASVVAGADPAPDSRESFTERFGAQGYASAEEMCDDAALDAVYVTTPTSFHASAARTALGADLPVLVEKPPADSAAAAESVAEAAADSAGFCMFGFMERFNTTTALVEDLVESGRFGEITHVEVRHMRRRGIPNAGTWFTDEELAGGGALFDIGVYAVDLVFYLLDFPEVTEVTGETRRNFGGQPGYADPDGWAGGDKWAPDEAGEVSVEDSASAFIRSAGPTVSLEVAWAVNRPEVHELTIRGTEAGATFDIGGDAVTVHGAATGSVDHYSDDELRGSREETGLLAEDRTFLDAVAAGEPPADHAVEEGVAVQRVLDAVYRSSDRGEAVTL
jgi:predicted dehydrogenase